MTVTIDIDVSAQELPLATELIQTLRHAQWICPFLSCHAAARPPATAAAASTLKRHMSLCLARARCLCLTRLSSAPSVS